MANRLLIESRRLVLTVILSSVAASPVSSMTVNLASPYTPEPSIPRVAGVTFYAPGADDFLLDRADQDPRIICVPHSRALSMEWALHHNLVRTPIVKGTAEPREDNSFLIPLPVNDLAPGFYDIRVKIALTADSQIEAITTFGWRVGDIALYPIEPKDFDTFWKEALAKLDQIVPQPKWTLEKTLRGPEIDAYNQASAALPGNYDPAGAKVDAVEVYRVTFQGYGGRPVEGWYTKPVGDGPFPTLLVLPGAGNNARPAPVEHARHGYAALDIQVHGNPVDAPSYSPLPDDGSKEPSERLHYRLYLNALQGARVARLLPGADPDRLAVLGGSQGGRMSVVVAALDPSIKAAIPAITHYAYRPWGKWVGRMNRAQESGGAGFGKESAINDGNQSDAYLDVLNFAPRVRCPVLMNAGLIDPISSPTGVYAVYQKLAGPKEIVALPNTGHDWSPAFDRKAWKWLEKQLAPAR